MIKSRWIALVAAAGIAVSSAAWAQQAVTTRTANVRAGPERDFPLVATLPPGAAVNVHGCLSDYRWCDVDFGGGRGWISTRSLQSYYGNAYVPFYSYAPTIGLPIVTFSLFNYWDSYYRNRPWYRDRPRWESRWRDYDRRPHRDAPRYEPPRIEHRPSPPAFRPHVEGPRPQYGERPNYRPPEQHINPGRPPQQQFQRPPERPAAPQPAPRGTGRMSNRDSEPSREHQGQ